MMIKSFFSKIRFAVLAVAIAAVILIPSCKEQDVMFKQYTVEGGISYLGVVSGVKTRVGMNRMEVSFSVADPITAKVGIYWNGYEDSVMIDVEPGEPVAKIIDLPEGQYSLFIKSYDAHGNASNPLELITKTVGAKYLAMISHRRIKKKMTGFNSDLSIEWENSDNIDARFTEIIYTSTDGTEKRIRVENGVSETKIDDYKQGTMFKRTTYYSPDGLWLDSITPGIRTERDLTVDKKLGKVIGYSTQTTGDEAIKFYDDDANTVWQTNNRYPEYATIDLGVEVPVTGFGIVPSGKYTAGKADPRAPTTVKFEVSLDNDLWTSVGDYVYDNGLYYEERLFNVEQVNARYVRFTGVECTGAPSYGNGIGGPNTVKMVLAELNVNISIEASGGVSVEPFTLTPLSLTMTVGEVQQIIATERIPGRSTFTYTSGNSNVATVDETGTVRAVSQGTTAITVRYGSVEKTVSVTVYEQLDRTGWTATARNGNFDWGEYGGSPQLVLDGDRNTGWHTTVGSPLPQCMVVDMKASILVDRLVLWHLPAAVANNWIYFSTIEVYLSDAPVTPDVYQSSWGAPVATYEYPGGFDGITIKLNPNSRGRYLVLYFPNSRTNTYISFMELNVYGE